MNTLRQSDPEPPSGAPRSPWGSRKSDSPFTRLQQVLQELEQALRASAGTNAIDGFAFQGLHEELRQATEHAEKVHRTVVARSEALSLAQADAIVHSAEIIDELERTKLELMEARRLAEQHQEERVQLLKRVFENAREGVVILDSGARIEEANPVFREISQCEEAALIGRPLKVSLEWAFAGYDEVLRSVMAGEAWTGRVIVARGDRDERSFLVSFSPVLNGNRLTNVIVMFSDVTDIDRTQRRLKRQALHDQLTGLPNRRFFRERIESLIEESRNNCAGFGVCFIDLDDFKHVNDSLGHQVGDDLLVEVARRIQAHAGSDAFVARFGGDEFAMLIPNPDCDPRKVAEATDNVLRALRAPVHIGGSELPLGASIGVTLFPDHATDVEELLQDADVAMYAAKRGGRSQARMFAAEMRQEVEKRHLIQRELHRALQGNEISLLYQPLVKLSNGEPHICEALARWRTPDGRQISPGEFVPVAEKTGLITTLGDYVLAVACRQLVEWEAAGCRPRRVAVNISPQQLHGRAFVDRVREILDECGADPRWLTLEITENAVMDNVPAAMRTMDALTQLGIQLALDDFGTGQSSLSYLKNFNIHKLKIDRSFVKDLPNDERAIAIVESIIHLGQGRDLLVVAEGIESEAQYHLLRQLGCDLGQGFYISHPLRAVEFEAWRDLQLT
ncbi:MAG: putative bifunctional diguanylate cyclase/phosphodiesterase [Planctomycetaceae bacterium]